MGEVALSVTLLAGAGLLVRTLVALNHVDVGFRPHGLSSTYVRLTGKRFADSNVRSSVQRAILDGARGIAGVRGAMYVATPDGNYVRAASLGVPADAGATAVKPGEGVLGRALVERKSIRIESLPPDYLRIESGLGSRQPHALLVAPLALDDATHGVIELGNIFFAAPLQKSRGATEAIFLMLRQCFERWGYRRVEWKCDARNRRSQRAALRFGFQREGYFRQHMVIKGESRDTAWFAIIDRDWPRLRDAYRRWLAPANFDREGRQRAKLRARSRGY